MSFQKKFQSVSRLNIHFIGNLKRGLSVSSRAAAKLAVMIVFAIVMVALANQSISIASTFQFNDQGRFKSDNDIDERSHQSSHALNHRQNKNLASQCFFKSNIVRPLRAQFSPNPIQKEQFESTLVNMNQFFQPLFEQHGLHLRVVSEWENDFVTAFATINDALPTIRMVHLSGALARHEAITPMGLDAVICHEIGHHLGGAPTRKMILGDLSNEGQADYYTTLKCLRHLYREQNNIEFIKGQTVPPLLKEKCEASFSQKPEEVALCIRVALTAKAAAQFSAALEREKQNQPVPDPKFATPSSEVVEKTRNGHSPAQCRLDTFFQGSICTADAGQMMSITDPAQGACTRAQGNQVGVRPTCWFKPDSPTEITPATLRRL